MPAQLSYPGVYIQEKRSGAQTITGVPTSIALFVGMTPKGPFGKPTRIFDYASFVRTFGDSDGVGELPLQVRQFFLNGGSDAWILRTAHRPQKASVDLLDFDDDVLLTLSAAEAGTHGNLLRAEVAYIGPDPEHGFELTVIRCERDERTGAIREAERRAYGRLSMDTSSHRSVERLLERSGADVRAEVADPLPAPTFRGYSIGGLVFDASEDDADLRAWIQTQIAPGQDTISVSVDGSPFETVALPDPTAGFGPWQTAINAAVAVHPGAPTIQEPDFIAIDGEVKLLRLRSATVGGSVRIAPGPTRDLARVLQLGTSSGGLEVDGYATCRPQPTGLTANLGIRATSAASELPSHIASLLVRDGVSGIATTLTPGDGTAASSTTVNLGIAGSRLYLGSAYTSGSGEVLGSLRNLREHLASLSLQLDTVLTSHSSALPAGSFRIHVRRNGETVNPVLGAGDRLVFAGVPELTAYFDAPGASSGASARAYPLGANPAGRFYDNGNDGTEGAVPALSDYRDAFDTARREIDVFNLLVLPRGEAEGTVQPDSARFNLWGMASAFCQQKRAFLLVDPGEGAQWSNAAEMQSSVGQIRDGLVKDHAALYWPRVRVPTDSGLRTIDPAGSIAGAMARLDGSRGVWKATAGLEADLRSVRGVEHSVSDPENGILNEAAANVIRDFASGIAVWGARTVDGFDDSGNTDYKYVPVRRLALFIEESLYRGLRFAVFEPNAEPLWAQIRMAAGAFMHRLYREGAFKGAKRSEAYSVKVDSETTTQDDILRGVVNVVVQFAPVRPAEFIVVTIQQMAGQGQV